MTLIQALLAFLAAASILTVTPGVDTAMVLRNAGSNGARSAAFAALGIGLGCLVWGALVSVGLGALLAASPTIFTAVKWAGAAYLVWLGLKLVMAPRQTFEMGEGGTGEDDWGALRKGFLTNVLNPKVGVFYITFLPQFVPAGAHTGAFSLLLAAIHVLLTLAWFTLLIAATVPVGRLLRRPRTVRILDRMTGVVFIAFGAKLALSK